MVEAAGIEPATRKPNTLDKAVFSPTAFGIVREPGN
jgi:hypothetical protein